MRMLSIHTCVYMWSNIARHHFCTSFLRHERMNHIDYLSKCQSPLCSSSFGPKVRTLARTQVLTTPTMTDIHPQLAMLLGRDAKDIANIRKTCEVPPRVSVIDVTMAITGKDRNHAAEDFRRIIGSYPEVNANCVNLKFKGSGQRDTPVTDARGIVEIVMLLGGRQAARVRRQAAELLVRYLGGDLSLVDEVCRIRGFAACYVVKDAR